MELSYCALVITILGACSRKIDGNNVTLTPSPEAEVAEGETLKLQCVYTGSFTLISVNWYLNGNSFGLEVDAGDCSYISVPPAYEVSRYNSTCSTYNFSLLITNVTKDKDDGNIWACDTTPIGSTPPTKAQAKIRVIERTMTSTSTTTTRQQTKTATTYKAKPAESTQGPTQNSKPGNTTEPIPVSVVIGISVGCGGLVFVIIIICCCYCCPGCPLYRFRKGREYKAHLSQDAENHTTNRNETKTSLYELSDANHTSISQHNALSSREK